jgi:hypothetical protein
LSLLIVLSLFQIPILTAEDSPHFSTNINQDAGYTLSVVGGEDQTFTFDGTTIDGITIGQTTIHSQYPDGMTFTAAITADDSEITAVTLFRALPNGSSERTAAIYDDLTETWTAHAWQGNDPVPPWREFAFYWSVVDDRDVNVRTDPIAAAYWDPTREWYRAESDYIVLYWFGLDEVDPEYIAQRSAEIMDETGPRQVEGFGYELGYKPLAVIYPTRESTTEISGGTPMQVTGLANSAFSMVYMQASPRDDGWFERQAECIHLTPADQHTEQFRIDNLLEGTVPHEITHLYQFAGGVDIGYNWWVEGQAEYFQHETGIYHPVVSANDRVRQLSALQDNLPSLQGNNFATFSFEADGCYALGYDVGSSFIGYIVDNYGGLATHRAIIEQLQRNIVLTEAIENVLGQPFLEIENAWRAAVGFPTISPESLDPTLRLQDPIAALYNVGDTFSIPGPRPLSLAVAPGPNQLSNGAACFAGTEAEVLRVGSIDGLDYYEIGCSGFIGWATTDQLP